jgi:hypothetical protein
MLKTIEAIIDTQGKIHWQEQPPVQGECRVLITILEERPHETLMQRWQNLRTHMPEEGDDIDCSELRDHSSGRNVEL